jgi:hypothetical protein
MRYGAVTGSAGWCRSLRPQLVARLPLRLGWFPIAPLPFQLADPVAFLIVPILSAFRRSSFRLPALALPAVRLFGIVHTSTYSKSRADTVRPGHGTRPAAECHGRLMAAEKASRNGAADGIGVELSGGARHGIET